MKVSLNWLKDLVSISETPQELSDTLTLSTCEVDEIHDLAAQFEGVIVAEVVKVSQHPDADRLRLATVNDGSQEIEVVCGAPNLEEGQLVAFAPVGTELPNGMKLEKVKIRGVVSEGMICAEDELGISDDHEGIMVLDSEKATIGMPFAEYMGATGVVLEIDNKSITHRPDLFSHIGIAREISAIHGEQYVLPEIAEVVTTSDEMLTVSIEDSEQCQRYMGVVVENITMNPTPDFMVERLEACGIRSKNIVVDITNYVMLEWGQPLHAFDFAKLSGDSKEIIVRNASAKEEVETLDGEARELSSDDLVITDSEKVIAIAGVMGAANSEVDSETRTIILESATFNGVSVRRTSRRLGLRSEAVLRFEKGLPVELPDYALRRAIELLVEYAGATVASEVVDEYPVPFEAAVIALDEFYVSRVLGFTLEHDEIESRLKLLGFEVEGDNGVMRVTIPWHRQGMSIEEELIEEVGRLYGTDSIVAEPFSGVVEPASVDQGLAFEQKSKHILASLGMDEIRTYSYYGEKLLKSASLSIDDHLELEDPLSEDLRYLRRSLLPTVVEKLTFNIGKVFDPKVFEVGHVYEMGSETVRISGAIHGKKKDIFYELKGIVEAYLSRLNISFAEIPGATTDTFSASMYDTGAVMAVNAGNCMLGTIGLLDAQVSKNLSVKKGYVAVFDFSLSALMDVYVAAKHYESLPQYPAATLDLAFVVPNETPVIEVSTAIRDVSGELLDSLEVFDVYRGQPLDGTEKSIAYHLEFRSSERTLEDSEIKKISEKIVSELSKKFNARLRDF